MWLGERLGLEKKLEFRVRGVRSLVGVEVGDEDGFVGAENGDMVRVGEELRWAWSREAGPGGGVGGGTSVR